MPRLAPRVAAMALTLAVPLASVLSAAPSSAAPALAPAVAPSSVPAQGAGYWKSVTVTEPATRTVTKTRKVTKTRTVTKKVKQVRTTAALNLRKKASARSARVALVKKNTVVTAGKSASSWRSIKVKSKSGWVLKKYLRTSTVSKKVKQKYTVTERYTVKEKYTKTTTKRV